MRNIPDELMQLILRIQQFPGGFTRADYEDIAIISSRGFEPRALGRLKSRTQRRELAEVFFKKAFRTPGSMRGNIVMGRNDGGKTCYDSKYSPMHLCGIGQSGSGKTVFLVSLLVCYLTIAGGIWLFDFCKRSLRGFLRIAEKAGRKAVVCRHECAFNNPLDPEDIDPTYYVNICAEFLTITLNLPPVARHILKICLMRLYENCGLFNDHRAAPPILTELLEEVRTFEGNKASRDAITIRLEAMLANKRQIFAVRRGFQIKDLERQVIIWEFDGLETEYQNLLTMQLVCKLFARRVKFVPEDLIVVALDEAARLYSKHAESAAEGPSFVDTMTSVVREKLISLKVITQTAHGLSNSIIANSGIKVLFAAGSPQDYEIFGRSMGLSSDQIQWAKTNLTVGSQIIKMSFGYLQPFVNHIDNLKIPQDVTDEEVLKSVEPLISATLKANAQPAPVAALPSTTAPDKDTSPALTSDEESLLNQIRLHPEITSATGHYKLLNTGTKRATAAKQGLLSKGFIKETVLESGRRGKSSLYLEVADEKSPGHQGSNLHQYLKDKVANCYVGRGGSVVIEKHYRLNGIDVFVDVVGINPDGTQEAVEVETQGSEHAVGNIRKCLALDFPVIHVLTPNGEVRRGIESRLVGLCAAEIGRIRFSLISLFEQELS
jgi:hypothetical protein